MVVVEGGWIYEPAMDAGVNIKDRQGLSRVAGSGGDGMGGGGERYRCVSGGLGKREVWIYESDEPADGCGGEA